MSEERITDTIETENGLFLYHVANPFLRLFGDCFARQESGLAMTEEYKEILWAESGHRTSELLE